MIAKELQDEIDRFNETMRLEGRRLFAQPTNSRGSMDGVRCLETHETDEPERP